MKVKISPYLLAFALSSQAFAADDAGDFPVQAYSEYDSGLVKVLEQIPEAKTAFEQCKQSLLLPNGNTAKDISDCTWQTMPSDAQAKVQELLTVKDKNNGDKVVAKYDGVQINNLKRDKAENSALKKLEEYLFKSFTEKLYEADGKSNSKLMNHKVFLEMYQSQLGKSLISATSSYCIEANISGNCGSAAAPDNKADYLLPKANEPKCRDTNLAGLNTSAQTVSQEWQNCMAAIQHICHKDDFKDKNGKSIVDYASKADGESQKRACAVTAYMKDVRQALIETEKLGEEWDKRIGDNDAGVTPDNYQGNIDLSKKKDVLTNLSVSKTFVESGYDKESDKEAALAKECAQNYDSMKAECDKFLIEKENADELATEYGLRSKALQKKVEEDLLASNPDSDKNLENYLTEEGYSKDKIAELISTKGANALKQEISEKYKKEREAVNAAVQDKIKGRIVSNNPQGQSDSQTVFQKIADELSARANDVKQLMAFNNIVSGFLTIEVKGGGDDQKFQNTQALLAELEHSAFDLGRTPGSSGAAGSPAPASNLELDKIKEQTKDLPQNNSKGSAPSTLGVETINDNFLNH
jgi:broad-specificity NMP kinase